MKRLKVWWAALCLRAATFAAPRCECVVLKKSDWEGTERSIKRLREYLEGPESQNDSRRIAWQKLTRSLTLVEEAMKPKGVQV